MVVFKNFFGTPGQSEIMTTALDLATTAASLASNPADIEPLINQIDLISSRSDAMLSAKDEALLFDIYLKIERYLLTSDPIRKFNKEELRAKASRGLHARLEAYEQTVLKKQLVNV